MARKTCVFVDGENFRSSIERLFEREYSAEQYLPKEANWAGLFDWISGQADRGGGYELLRTYWYVIETIDYWPYRLPNPEYRTEECKALLCKDEDTSRVLSGLEGEELTNEMKTTITRLRTNEDTMRKRARGWRTIQEGIALKHDCIEFRRAGAINFNLFKKKLGTEKAVDVKLATDLIVLRNNYDLAVIISGDQDYVPAVEHVKDQGKTVVNVGFLTLGGDLLPGGARRLNEKTDWHFAVPYVDFRKFLGLK